MTEITGRQGGRETVRESGFTTIELLVTISILILLSGVILTYNRTGDRQLIFLKEKSKVLDAIYEAKSLSINTFVDKETPCGFGVSILNNRDYVIFKDLPNSGSDCSSADGTYTSENSENENFKKLKLDQNIEFDLSANGGSKINVVFIPPDPILCINCDLISGNKGDVSTIIKLRTTDKNTEGGVYVSSFGQIEGNITE